MDLELYLGIHDQFTKFEKDFALFRMVDGPGFCNGSFVSFGAYRKLFQGEVNCAPAIVTAKGCALHGVMLYTLLLI